MAILNSDEYALHIANPPQGIAVSLWGARVRMRLGLFSGLVGFAQDDVVRFFPIYPGERPLQFHLRGETNTASLTVSLGLYDKDGVVITAAKYVAATAITTAANVIVPSLLHAAETVGGVVGGLFAAANPSDTADLEVIMLYVRD